VTSVTAHREGKGWRLPLDVQIFRPDEERIKFWVKVSRYLVMDLLAGFTDWDDATWTLSGERAALIVRPWEFWPDGAKQALEARICTPFASTSWCPLPALDSDRRVITSFGFSDDEAGLTTRSVDSVVLQVRPVGETVHPPTNATVYLVGQEGMSVISDLDDTVKVSEVFRGYKILLQYTFVKPFIAIAGMANLYRRWVQQYGADIQFVSKAPSELFEKINEFLLREGFPTSTINLPPFLTKSKSKFKADRIEAILADFPSRQFVLVGDSGEQDAQIYADVFRRHPDQITNILIREVDPSFPVNATIFQGIAREKWQVFRDPAEISSP
jgi:hypothetical protein